MIEIAVKNLTKKNVFTKVLRQVVRLVLEKEKIFNASLSVVFVGKDRARTLNKLYQKKDWPAEVLSFGGREKGFKRKIFLGEIIICPSVIEENSRGLISYKKALIFFFIHGLLHLLGYHHKNKRAEYLMRIKEKKYWCLSVDF